MEGRPLQRVVGLRYDPDDGGLPEVILQGAGPLAEALLRQRMRKGPPLVKNEALVDALYRSRYRAWSRRLPAMLGFSLAAAGTAAMPFAQTAPVAVAFFGLATLGAELTISPSWTFCLDIAGKRSGEVTGTMNMAGNFGSFVSANAFPFFNRVTGGAGAYFSAVAVLSSIAALCWTGMGTVGKREKIRTERMGV